jgi:hypothetical protein
MKAVTSFIKIKVNSCGPNSCFKMSLRKCLKTLFFGPNSYCQICLPLFCPSILLFWGISELFINFYGLSLFVIDLEKNTLLGLLFVFYEGVSTVILFQIWDILLLTFFKHPNQIFYYLNTLWNLVMKQMTTLKISKLISKINLREI